jgi:hypothetical protein
MNYVGREFMCHLHHNVYVILLMTTNCYVFNFVCLEAETNSLIMEMEYVICLMNVRFFAHLWLEPIKKIANTTIHSKSMYWETKSNQVKIK